MSDLARLVLDELAGDPEALERLRVLVGSLPTSTSADPWIGVADAAEHLACKPRRIYDLVEADRIPYHRDGSRLLFRRSELDDWIERCG